MKIKIAALRNIIKVYETQNARLKQKIIDNNAKITIAEIEIQKAENYTPKPPGKWQGNGMSDKTIEVLKKKV